MINPPAGFAVRHLPAQLFAITILTLSSIPGNVYPKVDVPMADKWVHFVLYAPFGWLLARCVAGEKPIWIAGVALPFLAGSTFAAMDEIHQLSVLNRTCSLTDWFVDVMGVAAGTALWLWMHHTWGNSKQRANASDPPGAFRI